MPTKQHLLSKAPTRIDLAGGTVDIWPIYLFLPDPVTINLGISLFAESELSYSPDGAAEVVLKSDDQGHELRATWGAVTRGEITPPPQLELHAKLLRFFLKERIQRGMAPVERGQFLLKTRAKSPAGAGLGGSSTLSISMIGALGTWALERPIDPDREGEDFIEIVRDVETTVIQVPAGLQDYYGAMYGGLQSLRWGFGRHQRQYLDSGLLDELSARILLFYSGQSRNSGINNWALFKSFIDKQGQARAQFAELVKATQSLEQALVRRDWTAVGQAIASEWETRKGLASGITTPEIDRAFAEARALGPVSGKICGAGGGGCFFVYLPQQDAAERTKLKENITKIFEAQGLRNLPFQAVPRGLTVQSLTG